MRLRWFAAPLVACALVGVLELPADAAVLSRPLCSAAQVSVSPGRYVEAMGQFAQTVVLVNRSTHACSLSGFPSVRLPGARHGGGYLFGVGAARSVLLAPHRGVASFTFGGAAVTAAGVPCPTVDVVPFVLLRQPVRTVAATVPVCGAVDVSRTVAIRTL